MSQRFASLLPLALTALACSPGFQQSRHYATVAKHLDVGGQVLLYADVDGDLSAGADYVDRWTSRLGKAHPDWKLERINAKRLVGQLGLDQVLALGLSSVRDGDAFYNKAFFAYAKPRRGLLLMSDTPPREPEVLRQAPRDVDVVFENDLKLKSFLQLIETIAQDLAGGDAKQLFEGLDQKLPTTSLTVRQIVERLDTRLVGVVRVDEQRSFPWPGSPDVIVPGCDLLVSLDGMAVVFDAYAGLLRSLPNASASSDGDLEWIEIDAAIAGAPWLKPVLGKHAKTGRLFLASSKAFAMEYLVAKQGTDKALADAPDWRRAAARFARKANGTSYVSGAFLAKVARFVRPLAKDNPEAQTAIDLVLDLLPAPGVPYAAQQVNLDDGMLSVSYGTFSHKATLFPALAAGPIAAAGAAAAVAVSRFRSSARSIAAAAPTDGDAGEGDDADDDGKAGDRAVDRYRIPLGGPSHGAPLPTVSIVEITDFQCPFCGRVNPTLAQLLQRYPDDVRIYLRHNPLPFHADAVLAAQAAMAAHAQGKFWEMHDLLFANQKSLKRAALDGYAKTLGLDLGRFAAALDQGTYKKYVEDDVALAAQWGATGTPSFFINGRPLTGAQPLEKFTKIVDQEIATAKRLLAKGTKREGIYERLMAEASEPKPYQPKVRTMPELSTDVYKVPLGNAPGRGGRAPKVTIVEYSDFQCPFCARARNTLDELAKTHGDELRLVFKHNPLSFHHRALPAALAAEAAREQGKFWPMHDLLFAHQHDLGDEQLEGYAREIGLDIERYRADLKKVELRRRIEADQAEASRFGVKGAPVFFVNGRPLHGAQPIEQWNALIDQELAKANAKLRQGKSRAKLYAELTRGGLERAPKAKVEPGRPDPDLVYRAEIDGAPVRGPKDALVTIVEMGDYECPFCRRVEPTLTSLLDTYQRDVRLAWRDMPLPFHPRARQLAIAARAAGEQGKYWEMHDKLLGAEVVKGDMVVPLETTDVERYARELGLDLQKFTAATADPKLAAAVDADIAMAKRLGVTGTPAFFINGKYLGGAQPFAVFKQAVDEELKAARKLVAKGTPRAKVYGAIMRNAKTDVDKAAE